MRPINGRQIGNVGLRHADPPQLGGRGVYFDELNGHSIELLTVSH
jgi:hypothetical protein